MILYGALLAATLAGSEALAGKVEVTAKVVSDGSRVGVLFAIPKGKHIYWSNPGDSGLPTRVVFRLPKGCQPGPLHWPVPEKFVQPGDITGYGYEGEVLLWADAGCPLTPGSPIAATVSWLECDNRECVAGQAGLEGERPLAVIPNDSDRWLSRLPESGATAKLGNGPSHWELAIPWKGRRGSVRWVASGDPRAVVTDVEVIAGDPVRIRCTVAAAPGERFPAGGIDVLVAYKSLWSEMKGILVKVPGSDR